MRLVTDLISLVGHLTDDTDNNSCGVIKGRC